MCVSDGRKIGIIGYITPVTKDVSNSEDMIFLDEIEAVTKVQTDSPGGKSRSRRL
jgi:2',3'-cyclic-nucleotide 2'-phosphodiesterase (5'-nucleotidase family)